jgi:hypothetical protein
VVALHAGSCQRLTEQPMCLVKAAPSDAQLPAPHLPARPRA